MFRKSAALMRRIPAIIMIQNSETDGAAYLGHFQKSLLSTNLRLVHFKMFNKEHLRLLPQCVALDTMRKGALHCTHTNPQSLSPSLAATPRASNNDAEETVAANNAAGPSSSSLPSTVEPLGAAVLPSCVMTPCEASDEGSIDYHVVGVISLGGPMSAADDANYPFIKKVMTLMRSAVEADVPVLGICLGSQMLSRAMGGEVTVAPIGEKGFVPQRVEEGASFHTPEAAAAATARGLFDWFGGRRELLSYHWHGDTFSVPPTCVRIATGDFCANQAFQVPYKYALGVQWHPDIDGRKARAWLRADEVDVAPKDERLTPGLVTCGEFLQSLEEANGGGAPSPMAETQRLADDIFSKWFEGVELCRARRVVEIGAPSHEGRHPLLSPTLVAAAVSGIEALPTLAAI